MGRRCAWPGTATLTDVSSLMNGGCFIEGYYLVGLIAQALLARHPGAAIIHDPRLPWNTIEMVREAGGRPVLCKTGQAFIKERMRLENAIYGGEMSGHHYFRDFAYCDSGMIPWLLVLQIMCRTRKPLSSLVAERMTRYPVSGEINRTVGDPDAVLQRADPQSHSLHDFPAVTGL